MLNQVDLSRADLNLLVLFETVLSERNVGRAAGRLNLTPSAVSHGLGRLRRLLNDPLFLRTPRGVAPTERAIELAPKIAAILASVRGVIASAEPFVPETARRTFRLGAPDAALGVFGPELIGRVARAAPGVRLSLIHVMPRQLSAIEPGAWDHVLADLDSGVLDLAVIPEFEPPARFEATVIGTDQVVAATRAGHPFARNPTLAAYCAGRHMLMSQTGATRGVIDDLLERMGQSRRIAVVVPNFMLALPMVASSDLIVALPASLVAAQGARYGLVATPIPMALPRTVMATMASRAALEDAGVAWLREEVAAAVAAIA